MNCSSAGPEKPDGGPAVGVRIEDLLKDFLARAGELLHAQEHMRGLLEAVVAVAEDLSLDAVLDRVVRSACRLLNARYGALGVIGEDQSLSHFITVGIDDDLAHRIGPRPTGHGVLGLLITEPEPLRLHDLRQHPNAYGFPAHHPPMKSFLGVPIRVRDVVFGNLYLTEKDGGGDFTPEDEDLAVALAAAAGVAIENARLYEEARRRASWLEASMDVTGRMLGDDRTDESGRVALDVVADKALRESGAQLALILVPDDGVGSYRVVGVAGADGPEFTGRTLPMDSPEIRAVADTGAPACVEDAGSILGPGDETYWGKLLAVDLSAQGSHHGLLVLVRAPGTGPFPRTDVDMGAVFGSHVALALELDRIHRLREQLVVFSDRDRIARDLHDLVIQRLFAAGLSIQSLRRFTSGESALNRIDAVTQELDGTIRDLRNTIYSLQADSGEPDLLSSRILRTVRNVARPLPFAPHLALTGDVDSIINGVTTIHLLAVLSEALSNAVRHSGAQAIWVSVAVTEGTLVLTVEDNGQGFNDPKPGNGLLNMDHRARELKGTCAITSAPTKGTTLVWSVPAR
ncbi:sensor histidine kinase [Arthrobacter sp. Soil762]|uniref:sensor histidine kinase n=1 Tax=Arthrobacter sp. Soil762 TaxID=1736401 RepID=UPI0006FB7394|nr:GAF domain-containing sensor histidine kinase [Arthrobacter sp. Soil762]KRE80421.1 histidine kinase [Arthrobacter sp. Soil762]